MLSHYDQRQIFLLSKQIEGFEEGSLTLSELADRSQALLNVLQEVDGQWIEPYRGLLFQLELYYEVDSDNEEPELGVQDLQELRSMLDELKGLLSQVTQ